jgi:hypothetical protein
MPVIVGALVSLLIAWLRGASPLALGEVRLRWLLLPLIAFGIQLFAFGLFGGAGTAAPLWQLVSVGLLLAFVAANLRYRALLVFALGALLNLMVVVLNGGYMPARPDDVRAIGFPQVAERLEAEGHFQKTGRLDESTRLPFLADVIRVPLPGPDRLISAGDVLVAVGVFLFVQEALVRPRPGVESGGGRHQRRRLSRRYTTLARAKGRLRPRPLLPDEVPLL